MKDRLYVHMRREALNFAERAKLYGDEKTYKLALALYKRFHHKAELLRKPKNVNKKKEVCWCETCFNRFITGGS